MYHLVRAYYLLLSLQLICALILQSVLYVIAVLCSNRPLQTTPTPRFLLGSKPSLFVRPCLAYPNSLDWRFTGKSPPVPCRCHHVTIVGRGRRLRQPKKFWTGMPISYSTLDEQTLSPSLPQRLKGRRCVAHILGLAKVLYFKV